MLLSDITAASATSSFVSSATRRRFLTDLENHEYQSVTLKTLLTGTYGTSHEAHEAHETVDDPSLKHDLNLISLTEWVERYKTGHRAYASENKILRRAVNWFATEQLTMHDLCVMSERGAFSLANLLEVLWREFYIKSRSDGLRAHDVIDLMLEEDIATEFKIVISSASGINAAEYEEILSRFTLHDKAWGPLTPLTTAPATLPIHGLPGAVKSFIQEVARSIEVSTDMVTGLVIGTLGAATAGTVRLRVRSDWDESLNPAVLILADSSSRKSPVHKAVTKVLFNEEMSLGEKDSTAYALRKIKIDEIRREISELERSAKKKDDSTTSSAAAPTATPDPKTKSTTAAAAAKHTAFTEEMTQKKLILEFLEMRALKYSTLYEDITPEAFSDRLSQSWSLSITISSSETDLFAQATGLYSGGKNKMKNYLKAISGESLLVTRKSATDEKVPWSAAHMILMLQPGPFDRFLRNNADATDQGFIPRFNTIYPAKIPRTHEDRAISDVAVSGWERVILGIRNAATKHIEDSVVAQIEANRGRDIPKQDQYVQYRYIDVPDVVHSKWVRWKKTFTEMAEEGREFYPIRAWINKAEARPLVLAALLTLADDPTATQVSNVYFDTGIELVEALKHHAMFVMTNQDDVRNYDALVGIKSWLERSENDGKKLTQRDLQTVLKNHHWMSTGGRQKPSQILEDVLADLEHNGYIKVVKDASPGRGRKSKFIHLRPFELD